MSGQDKTQQNVAARHAVDQDWVASYTEDALEPDLPIIDPHHHLWDFANHRYLLDQLLADTGGGHNIRATVFIECTAMYRADGPKPMRPVGETEFVNGIAAMSASGRYGEMRACAGIVGFADLSLGAAVDEVLQAHIAAGGGRFRGIRRRICSLTRPFARVSPDWRRTISPSRPGSTIINCPRSPTSPAPSPTPR